MLKIVLLLGLVAASFAVPYSNVDEYADAAPCDETLCKLPNCRCASTSPPAGLELTQVPQFVLLTFDDAVTSLNFDIYNRTFYGRTNPDGCPISLTYFVSHEYTDYQFVHNLYVHNHEIALHSITHSTNTTYWQNIPMDDLRHEFGDEKTLIAHFANIPEEALQGMRLPFLQLSGDNSFNVAKELGLTWDCSWPTHVYRKPGLWPYTLDYRSNQDCEIGPCPTGSIPGIWVFPMIDWTDQENIVCSMTDACVNIPDDRAKLLQWFKDDFDMQYQGNRAPFGFYIHASWFEKLEHVYDAYVDFLDYLDTLNDVYIVGVSRAKEWIQNPVPLGSPQWPACPQVEDLGCKSEVCELPHGQEMHYMTICAKCPKSYPWINNPLGEDDPQ